MPICVEMLTSADAATAPEASRAGTVPVAPSRPGVIRLQAIPGLRFVLGTVLGTRLLVWGAALAVIAIFGEDAVARHVLDPAGVTPPVHADILRQLLAPGARWDSVWYVQIAAHGYFSPASTNFFPLYPLLVHLLTAVLGSPLVAGIAISLGCLTAALILLYRLALLDVGEPAARMTVLLVAVFPASLFLSAIYPTSLYLMLTLAALYAARRDQWAVAGLCGGLVAVTRSNGILVLALLALVYLYGPRGRSALPDRAGAWWRPRFRLERDFLWLALVPLGLATYLGYLWLAHDAPLEPYRAARLYWEHSFGPPLGGIAYALGQLPGDLGALIRGQFTPLGFGDPIGWQARNLIDILFLALALGCAVMAWRRVPRPYVLYSALLLAQVTSFPGPHEPMIGLPRYMLGMFGLFMGAGAYLAEHRRTARAMVMVSGILLVVFSGLWGSWSLVP